MGINMQVWFESTVKKDWQQIDLFAVSLRTDYNITCNQTFIFQVEVCFCVSNGSPMWTTKFICLEINAT